MRSVIVARLVSGIMSALSEEPDERTGGATSGTRGAMSRAGTAIGITTVASVSLPATRANSPVKPQATPSTRVRSRSMRTRAARSPAVTLTWMTRFLSNAAASAHAHGRRDRGTTRHAERPSRYKAGAIGAAAGRQLLAIIGAARGT